MTTKQFYENMYGEGYILNRNEYQTRIDNYKNVKVMNQLNRYVDVKSDWSILDVGCSIGKFLEFVQFKNKKGVDISDIAVNEARMQGLEIYQCDIEYDKLPFEDNSFDLIFCMEVLEHLFTEKNIFSEFKRVLKPGGYIYVTVPNDTLKFNKRIGLLFGKMIRTDNNTFDSPHIRFFESNMLSRLFRDNGFNVIYNGALPLSYKCHSFGWLSRFLSDTFTNLLANNYSIICKKKGD